MLKFLILFLVILQAAVTFAQSSARQEDVAERARRRIYDGGVDEQPLQVQKHLIDSREPSAYTDDSDTEASSDH